jgi:branched-chain amino acid transport system substrate-binding protein
VTRSRRGRRGAAAGLVAAALLLSGCGTRASDAEVRAGVEAGHVALDQASIDQLRTATGGAAQIIDAPGTVPTTSGPAEGTPGTAPGSATTPGKPTGTASPPTGTTSGASSATAATSTCTGVGAPLNLGQIGSFSGVLGAVSASARTSLAIWAKHVNARGGVACHPVTVYAADDGADPSRGAAAAQDLIVNKKVSALVGIFSPLSLPAILPVVEKHKVPVVGGDGVDFAWNSHPLLFPQGAGFDGLIEVGLQQNVRDGMKKLGLLYCVEASICTSMAKLMPAKAKEAGAEMVYQSPVSLTQTDFTAQCQNAKNAGVEGFGMGVDGSAIARVARSCAAIGFFPKFISGGGVISPAQSKDPGIRRNTMSVATPNAPWMRTDLPGQKEYAGALAQYSPGTETDGNSMTAWASAKLFEAAIAKLGTAARDKPILSPDVLTGLGKIKNETLGGLSPPITFTPGQKSAPSIKCIYFEVLTDKGWTAPRGSNFVCKN